MALCIKFVVRAKNAVNRCKNVLPRLCSERRTTLAETTIIIAIHVNITPQPLCLSRCQVIAQLFEVTIEVPVGHAVTQIRVRLRR